METNEESNNIKIVKIKIANKHYSLKVNSSAEESYYQKLANYVEKHIERIKNNSKIEDYKNVLILTCLTLADQIINNQNSNLTPHNDEKESLFNQKLLNLLTRLENYHQDDDFS